MGDVDPDTGIPMYDPCHMYQGGSEQYSACNAHEMNPADGGPMYHPVTATPWYDQTWFPVVLIGLLVVLVGIVGYIAYTHRKVAM